MFFNQQSMNQNIDNESFYKLLGLSKTASNKDIKKAISYGTSGFTAMLAFINLLKESKKISKKKLLIAGGTTGVGYFLLLILKNANYNVDVITSNKKNFVRLKSLGASKIYTYNEIFKLYNQPFIKKKYDIVFDNVGGDFFVLFLKILNKNGLYFSIERTP